MKVTKVDYLQRWMNKVVQGDCLKLMKDLPDDSIDTIITDPPYGVRDEEDWDEKQHFIDTVSVWLDECCRISKRVVWFCAGKMMPFIFEDRDDFFRLLVWNKPPGSQFKGASHNNIWYSMEPILLFGDRLDWNKKGKDSKMSFSVFDVNTIPKALHGHPTTKPIELMRWLVDHHTNGGDIILDPFCGSGSTLVAAKELKREYIGFELDGAYVQRARKRLVGVGVSSKAERIEAKTALTFEDLV